MRSQWQTALQIMLLISIFALSPFSPAAIAANQNVNNQKLDQNQKANQNSGQKSTSKTGLKLAYKLSATNTKEHFFDISIQISNNRQSTLDVAIPAWSPGRYVIHNFTRNIQDVVATTANDQSLTIDKLDKQTWRIACQGVSEFTLSYRVFANDLSGTFSQLNEQHGNYNGASIYMYLVDHKDLPIDLKLELPKNWRAICGASDNPEQTQFHFDNYDLLIDAPMEMGNFELESFDLDGLTYRVAFHNLSTTIDKNRLLQDIKAIVKAETAIFGRPDFKHYTFLIHNVPTLNPTDGMEHLNSTQVIEDGYENIIATVAHEFFHLWNVKRLRPIELGPWDYSREVYTKSLWISEGLTSYYGDISLARSGIWTIEKYCQEMAREIRTLQNRPGRRSMSLERSSQDTWVFLAVPRNYQTNIDNTVISYYNKGEIVGLMLDLEIRSRTNNRHNLDDVFRDMFDQFYLRGGKPTYYYKGKGFTPEDFLKSVNRVSGVDFTTFFQTYVSGTEEIDYNQFLKLIGFQLTVNGGQDYVISENPSASPEQLELRKALFSHPAK